MSHNITPDDVMPKGNASMPNDAPTVAVVVSLNIPGMTDEVAGRVVRFTRVALTELNDVGAKIILLDSSKSPLDPAAIADLADGVLFLGGGDVDANIYGHTEPVSHEYGVDRAADDYSIDIIKSTIERDAPMLCICRGSQLLNVALGGDLIPDIENYHPHRGGSGDPMFKDEPVILEPGSKIHHIFGRERVAVRSGHHQAVNRVADGLVVTARAEDGIVEGTELPSATWVVGVQWHPEDDDGSAGDRRALFQAFVDQTKLERVTR
ncbi:MAG: gamma-glutamyl-gamma-aminobutyrate hydrolase family protein [Microbacteriaceae bacterium]|nr:gamma-glutamyl-gamma-aminobutyrate hydrolase family protein [Microbacteriaceae bacterium]